MAPIKFNQRLPGLARRHAKIIIGVKSNLLNILDAPKCGIGRDPMISSDFHVELRWLLCLQIEQAPPWREKDSSIDLRTPFGNN